MEIKEMCMSYGRREPVAGKRRVGREHVSTSSIRSLFTRWNKGLMSGDPARVLECYADDAVLLPTFSDKLCLTQEDRRRYFEDFLKMKPRGRIDCGRVRIFGDIAVDSGLYSFVVSDGKTVRARYTFVYRREANGEWKIVEHHSSALPASE